MSEKELCKPLIDSFNPEIWRDKINLKFRAIKYKNSVEKLYCLKNKIAGSRELKKKFATKRLIKRFEKTEKNWKEFVDIMNIIQRNDPHFDYNFDPI